MEMATLRIGTCSWKYDSWRGIIYPQGNPLNYLVEYSRHYSTVEIDQWFWSLFGTDKVALPSRKTVQEYKESVPPDFKFTVKIPNSITLTHFYRKYKTDPLIENPHFFSSRLFEQFLESISPLHDQLGPLMFQFEYLNRQKMPSQQVFQERFGAFLEQADDRYQYAVEIRNPNYLNKSYFDFIKNRSLGHVFLQGYYMPAVVQVYREFKDLLSDFTVIRLHGPDRGGIEERSGGKWNVILEPHDNQLREISRVIGELLDRKMDIYVNMNNHYEGSAPLSIKRLEKFLSAEDVTGKE
jgi:uncharacterized protein YecE (DUF72 family)